MFDPNYSTADPENRAAVRAIVLPRYGDSNSYKDDIVDVEIHALDVLGMTDRRIGVTIATSTHPAAIRTVVIEYAWLLTDTKIESRDVEVFVMAVEESA